MVQTVPQTAPAAIEVVLLVDQAVPAHVMLGILLPVDAQRVSSHLILIQLGEFIWTCWHVGYFPSECESGKYGVDCQLSCPGYCKNNICDARDGRCTEGCRDTRTRGLHCTMSK